VSEPSITHVSAVDIRCVERDWPWARDNDAAIAAHWHAAKAKQPKLFDGPVFMFADLKIEGGRFSAVAFTTRFSRLLYAKRAGFPDPTVTNGFAMGALRAADGAFLLGVMGPETANRGQIYFPAGTPDPADRGEDGRLDLMGSIIRELAEETGLKPPDYEVGEGWTLARDGGLLAFLRPVRLPEPADAARARMLARMRRLDEQELSDIAVVRGPDEIDPARMPRFIQAFLRSAFAQAQPRSGLRTGVAR
jgi:8-oxo-dGTP pyrophosphatase MutT (NUDIX family)